LEGQAPACPSSAFAENDAEGPEQFFQAPRLSSASPLDSAGFVPPFFFQG